MWLRTNETLGCFGVLFICNNAAYGIQWYCSGRRYWDKVYHHKSYIPPYNMSHIDGLVNERRNSSALALKHWYMYTRWSIRCVKPCSSGYFRDTGENDISKSTLKDKSTVGRFQATKCIIMHISCDIMFLLHLQICTINAERNVVLLIIVMLFTGDEHHSAR